MIHIRHDINIDGFMRVLLHTHMEKLIVISGVSGCGKHEILENILRDEGLNLRFPISTTSRQIRGTEEDGVNYYFITPDEFREKIKNEEFLEYEEIYDGCFYGTEIAELERGNSTVILDMDPDVAWNIKQKYKDRVFIIFILPDSIGPLRKRLKARETESEKSIEERIRHISRGSSGK